MAIFQPEARILMKDFVMFPRKIRDDYINGKLTKNEFDVLVWVWINTNPVNGYFTADYKALEREFQNRVSYDNIRKIISSLRKKQYVSFLDHKGRRGSFSLYPLNFPLARGRIQTLEYLKNKQSITTQSLSKEQKNTNLNNNFNNAYHNFREAKKELIRGFSMDNLNSQITTSYNDNDNKNNNKIVDENFLKESANRFASNEKMSVNTFYPKTYEEQRCKEIAQSLGETDMNFILSRLKSKNGGFHLIERAWAIFKEIPQENIQNPRKYFNKLIRNLNK